MTHTPGAPWLAPRRTMPATGQLWTVDLFGSVRPARILRVVIHPFYGPLVDLVPVGEARARRLVLERLIAPCKPVKTGGRA